MAPLTARGRAAPTCRARSRSTTTRRARAPGLSSPRRRRSHHPTVITAPRSNSAVTEAPDFRPLYAQVKHLLVQRVIDGRWPPGTALPSEAQLALELRVSQGTVRKALDEMAARRVVVRRQGRGTFVAKHTNERSLFHFFHIVDANDLKELPISRIVALWADRAGRDQAARLAVPLRSKVVTITRLRFLGGKPLLHERSYQAISSMGSSYRLAKS
jgi:DNA-binding GntR family transcriptional regulator